MLAGPLLVGFLSVSSPADTLWPDTLGIPGGTDIVDQFDGEEGGEEARRELLENLLWRRGHPYDLNLVEMSELTALPFVEDAEAEAVMRFRREQGRFTSVQQLLTIPGVGRHAYDAISPYVTVPPPTGASSPRFLLRSRIDRQLPADPSLLGSPYHSSTRLSYHPSSAWEGGAVFEKDAGERMRDGFSGGYILGRGLWSHCDLVLGDFTVKAGQGLVLWRGGALFKTGWSATTPRRGAPGIEPHRSSDELRFLRGGALGYSIAAPGGRWQAILFVSQRSFTAVMEDDGSVSSLSPTTVYSSQTLLDRRGALQERMTGARVEFTGGERMTGGVTYVRGRFNRTMEPHDPFRASGALVEAAGMDIRMSLSKSAFFGEVARMTGGGLAAIAGTILDTRSGCVVTLVARSYAPGFDNPHAAGFGDNAMTRNEQGLYAGVSMVFLSRLRVSCSYDHFRHPVPAGMTPLPVSGDDLLLDVQGEVSRRVSVTGRYSARRTGTVATGRDPLGRETRYGSCRSRHRWRGGGDFRPSPRLAVRMRIEVTSVSSDGAQESDGLMLYHDLHLQPLSWCALDARLIFFDTDSYDARLYETERDLPGVFASSQLYGRGRRWYVVVRLDPAGWCAINAKFASTTKGRSVTVESAVREIPELTETEIGLQIEFRL